MSTLADLNTAIDAIAACIGSMQTGVISQADLDALNVKAAAALAACEAKNVPPTPPVVNAGSDKTATVIAESVALTGTVTPRGTGTLAWSKFSGPGNATFSTPTKLTTTATFDTAGTYVLRLTYTDGTVISNDVTVTVN